MFAPRLKKGDTIGIFCPSHVADPVRYERNEFVLNTLGFNVNFGENVYKDTYGYAAGAEERAADLNALVADNEVKMILFGGGDGAAEILPFINYENIRRHPKIFTSYSDATSVLLAVHAQTGLVTYYGLGVNNFFDLRHYDYTQFYSHFLEGGAAGRFVSDSKWKTLAGSAEDGIPSECEGTIIGGYISLFGLMLTNEYFKYEDKRYILVIEDHEHFSQPKTVASYLAFIGQSAFMKNVAGLIFGHFAVELPEELLNILARFGQTYKIPVVYTDDFGHGSKHAVFPIGVRARLDAAGQTLTFLGEA